VALAQEGLFEGFFEFESAMVGSEGNFHEEVGAEGEVDEEE
jgi:hypothetical protein